MKLRRFNPVVNLARNYATHNVVPQTMVEKIVQQFASGLQSEDQKVSSGDYISVKPLHVMTHDNTSAVMKKFLQFYDEKNPPSVKDKNQIVFTLDHNIQDKSEDNLKKYKSIENFAKNHNVQFYPAGRGIGHQVMVEEGHAWPLTMVVASDSHSNMYGGLGCLGTPIVRTDAAAIWATGYTWWQVPPIAKVELVGELRPGVSGKDVIISLCGIFNNDEVLNMAVEFVGEGVKCLSIDERLTIANMTTEWGALAGIFPVDEVTLDWLKDRSQSKPNNDKLSQNRIEQLSESMNQFQPDKGARYAIELKIDLSRVSPHASGPNHVKVMSSVDELENKKIKIHKAYVVSCVNSRVQDLAEAARVIKEGGGRIADGVEFYVAPASSDVLAESQQRGDWQILLDAGAKPLPPGCGPCIGLGAGLLQDGEVGISATNRNFKGRMGSTKAQTYLASPAVVAQSAINGYISSPKNISDKLDSGPVGTKVGTSKQSTEKKSVKLIDGFPSQISGDIVLCHQDNLNTDGIYPGKYTYSESITPEQQAQVAMENYDVNFQKVIKSGDILVGGFNFGTGSSREQAATCLKYRGIPLVIAGSFSETFKRNATNNGYLVIEVPELVRDLKERFGTEQLTRATGLKAVVKFDESVIEVEGGEKYNMSPVGLVAQELILLGGLEKWVENKLNKNL
ncbi:homoaconitate hydratase [Acrasis kona]|uniref:Homoaconitase, mitochondrial n=1 Tax=Acrasis kona TaxID=1008807 RepID=A0AAW2ZDD4_9EUKA